MIGGKPLDASIHARPFPPLLIFGHDCFSAVSSVPCVRLSGVTVNGGFDLNLNQPDFRGSDNWFFRFSHGRQFGVNKHLFFKGQFTPKSSIKRLQKHKNYLYGF